MVQKKDLSLGKLSDFKKKISRDVNIDRLVLFGSRASGTFSDGSDYDLLVISDDFKGVPWHKRAKELYMQWRGDIPVEFLCYTKDEALKASGNRWGIVSEALRTGVSI